MTEQPAAAGYAALNWDDLQRSAPRLGRVAHDRLIAPGVLLVATVRRDGAPRLSPVEPLVLDGQLWLSMMWRSQKAKDLLRDNRLLIHSIVTSRDGADGEIKLRGHAIPVDDPTLRRCYRDAVSELGWQPEEPYFHLFRVGIATVTYIRYAPNGDQHVTHWPEGSEFVRRATTPTSVGPPELSGDDLLAPEV